MAMRIAPVPHFWATVTFWMIGDFEQSIECSLKVKYKRLEQEEYEKLLQRVQAARVSAILRASSPDAAAPVAISEEKKPEDSVEGSAQPITDLQVIDQVMLDWDDVVGDDDAKLQFTKDNLASALKALGCKSAIVKRFFELHNKELEKNFARPPATTSAA